MGPCIGQVAQAAARHANARSSQKHHLTGSGGNASSNAACFQSWQARTYDDQDQTSSPSNICVLLVAQWVMPPACQRRLKMQPGFIFVEFPLLLFPAQLPLVLF